MQTKKRNLQKKRNKIVVFIIIVIGFIIFNYWGPRMIIQINKGLYSVLRPFKKDQLLKLEDFSLKAQKLNITTADKLSLKGLLFRTENAKQKGTIILVHGRRASKERFLPICKLLSDSGYNSVIIDLRAHGESEGEYCTYGFYEKQDLMILIDSIHSIKDLNLNIGIWGQSLGGAVALQTLAIDKRLKFGVVESTFSDFNTIIHDYFGYYMGGDIPFLSNYLIMRAENIAKFDAEMIKPSESAKFITQTMMIVHGGNDERIKIGHGKLIHENLACKTKEFIEYPEANHLNLWEIGGDEYFKNVITFMDKQN